MHVKRFLEWIGVKERLDSQRHIPPLVHEGDVWWCAIGENVGVEIDGKGSNFVRPVVILRKVNQHSFIGIPLSTRPRGGVWHTSFMHYGVRQTALLAQIRMFSCKRLHNRMGQLDSAEYIKLKEAYLSLF
jgi:mRNA interferase MazF